MASQTSTSILVSWQPPPIHSRNGIIIGFKLFYKRKGSSHSGYTVYIHNALTYNATGLLKYTEYELQVLAFTKIGDGPNSSVLTTRTRQDGKTRVVKSVAIIADLTKWIYAEKDQNNRTSIVAYRTKTENDCLHSFKPKLELNSLIWVALYISNFQCKTFILGFFT